VALKSWNRFLTLFAHVTSLFKDYEASNTGSFLVKSNPQLLLSFERLFIIPSSDVLFGGARPLQNRGIVYHINCARDFHHFYAPFTVRSIDTLRSDRNYRGTFNIAGYSPLHRSFRASSFSFPVDWPAVRFLRNAAHYPSAAEYSASRYIHCGFAPRKLKGARGKRAWIIFHRESDCASVIWPVSSDRGCFFATDRRVILQRRRRR